MAQHTECHPKDEAILLGDQPVESLLVAALRTQHQVFHIIPRNRRRFPPHHLCQSPNIVDQIYGIIGEAASMQTQIVAVAG